MKAADFPEGTEFFDIDWIPAAWLPDAKDPENWYGGVKSDFNETTLNNLDTKADQITPEEFDALVARSIERRKVSAKIES